MSRPPPGTAAYSRLMLLALRSILAILTLLMLVQDLVPLGRWNGLTALAPQSPLSHRVRMTLVNTATLAAAWLCTLSPHFTQHGSWQHLTTILILAGCVAGAFASWWRPWLFGATAAQQEKLRVITTGTYTFVPARNGITPNALHCLFHALILAALALTLRL
jgi:hypothetical protein